MKKRKKGRHTRFEKRVKRSIARRKVERAGRRAARGR